MRLLATASPPQPTDGSAESTVHLIRWCSPAFGQSQQPKYLPEPATANWAHWGDFVPMRQRTLRQTRSETAL